MDNPNIVIPITDLLTWLLGSLIPLLLWLIHQISKLITKLGTFTVDIAVIKSTLEKHTIDIAKIFDIIGGSKDE